MNVYHSDAKDPWEIESDCKKKHLTGSAIWRKEEVAEDRDALWEED